MQILRHFFNPTEDWPEDFRGYLRIPPGAINGDMSIKGALIP